MVIYHGRIREKITLKKETLQNKDNIYPHLQVGERWSLSGKCSTPSQLRPFARYLEGTWLSLAHLLITKHQPVISNVISMQIYPKIPGFPLYSYSDDGIFRPSILQIFGRGPGFLGLIPNVTSQDHPTSRPHWPIEFDIREGVVNLVPARRQTKPVHDVTWMVFFFNESNMASRKIPYVQ